MTDTKQEAAVDDVLVVRNLSVSFRTPEGRLTAVDNVSFGVRPSELFGLVGESGSGKSTTAFAILGLIKPPGNVDGGEIHLGGTQLLNLDSEALRDTRWREMSLIPQGAMSSLNPVMKVGDQIRDVIVTHEGKATGRQADSRIARLLEGVGLEPEVASSYPHELSGGMKQRVCIAMAVALEPKLIIADEPTSALDVVVQRVVAQTLKSVQARLGASIILIGHDLGLQAQLVDRIGVLHKGRLVEVGPTRDIFHQPRHPYTELLVTSAPSIKGRSAQGSISVAARRTQELTAEADRMAAEEAHPLRVVGAEHLAAIP